ncbi:MAG: hypothetical protein ACTS5I_17565 [Rhodanobacter sp.]
MRKIQILHSMPDESGASAATDSATESKRKQVSKRAYLKADGTEAERIEEASGARYTLLDPAGNHDFDQQFGSAATLETMCGIFGFHTKVGNVANTVLNDKDEPGTPSDAAAAIREFLTAASGGTWTERASGVGARIDKDALADAIVEVASAAGKTADRAKIFARLESDPTYVRAARQVPSVASAYASRVGRAVKSVDDLLG